MNNLVMGYLKGVFGIYQRWCTWVRLVYLIIATSLIALVLVQTEIADAILKGQKGLTWQPWVATYCSIYSYTLISPFIIHCCELWPLDKGRVFKTSIKLIALYIPTTLLFITIMLIFRNIIHFAIEGASFDQWHIIDRYLYEFPKLIGTYLVFVFVTYTKIYYDTSQKEQLNAAKLENELQSIRLQTLRSQLQPHFLFNTLNLISSTVYQDADKADSLITRLGDLLRYSLATEQKPFVSLTDELQAMRSYLEISQLRFGEKMKVKMNVSAEAERVQVPAMLLQPLLENAVKYGIEPSDDIGEIGLIAAIENKQLIMKISNPWHQSRQPQESFGIGLQNARSRINLLYTHKGNISLKTDGGKIVTFITLPIQTMENSHEQ